MRPLLLIAVLCWLLFSQQHTPSYSIATDTLSGGRPFTTDARLVSSNGKFAFGFFQTGTTTRAGKKARGSKLGSGSVRLGSARSGSRAWNEPSRASFLGSLKRRAEPSRLALAREPARELRPNQATSPNCQRPAHQSYILL